MADEQPVPERLIQAGAELFVEKGFGGSSVREICAAANTSSNMIHHYFGDKQGLLQAILDRCDEHVFAIPIRLLDAPVNSADDFRARFGLLFMTTLDACIDNRLPLLVALGQQSNLSALVEYQARFVEFLRHGRSRGWVRDTIEPALISGAVLDRITNYVLYAPWQREAFGIDVLGDDRFRRDWVEANLNLYLDGLVD